MRTEKRRGKGRGIAAIYMLVLLLSCHTSVIGPTPCRAGSPLVPVTTQCVMEAARYHSVPFAALLAIMDVEGGRVGESSQNTNGSEDLGPMQVNTIWLPRLARYGISRELVRDNGCVNVAVAAWILREHLKEATLWAAIGAYHSRTPRLAQKYQLRVWSRAKAIAEADGKRAGDVIARANGDVATRYQAEVENDGR